MTFTDFDWLHAFLPTPNPELAQHLTRTFIKKHVLQALQQGLNHPEYATLKLAKYFRQTRALGSKDRRRAADISYGIIRSEGFLRRCGATEPQEWVEFYHLLMKGEAPKGSMISPAADYAAALSLPEKIATEWLELHSSEALALGQKLMLQPPTYIRANLQASSRDAIQKSLHKENIHTKIVSDSDSALRLTHRANLIACSAYKNGLIEIQDLSCQRFCQDLDDFLGGLRGVKILDLCAGAGGKSLALAARGADIFAADPRSHALKELSKRAARARAQVSLKIPKKSDLVLLDVPCSGTGRLAREPALRWKYQKSEPPQHCSTQKNLLVQATKLADQYIVYATCSLLKEENTPSLEGWEKKYSTWYWPHQQEGDGFYWAIFKKES